MFITNSLSGDLVSLVTALLVILLAYCKWSYQYWQRRNVPFLEPQIPFGNISRSIRGKESICITFKRLYDEMKSKGWKHGGIYMFLQPTFLAIDLDTARNIMTKDFQYFADRNIYVNEKEPLQAHLISLTGSRWRQMRTKLTPTFTSGKMKLMFNVMAECQNDMQKRMDHECNKNEPINIKEILACFTTNIIGSCAFGLDCKALEDENSEFRDFGRKLFARNKWISFRRTFTAAFPKLSKFLNIGSGRKEVQIFIMNMVEGTVRYREKNNYVRNDFMQMLIDLKNNPADGKPLTMDELASQCLVFFAAGFETSSTLMTFALYELAKDQEIQERLRNEINSVLARHHNQITYDSIQDMKYLTQVIDESLRLHPPAPITNRRCVKDYKLPNEDIIIEKGTSVIIPVFAIHRDEEYYPNPTKFDPGRFSDEQRNSRHNYAHLPFGEGPRNCIGMRFGLLQSKMGLTCLIKNFKFTVDKRTKEPLVYRPGSSVLAVEGEVWLSAQRV